MCNLKRSALMNIVAGVALSAFGCVGPTEEDTSQTASAASIEPTEARGEGDEGREHAGPPSGAVSPGLPGEQRGPAREPVEGLGAEEGSRGIEAPRGALPGVGQGLMDPEATRQLVERIAEGIRAQVREDILRHRQRMFGRLGEIMQGPVGGPQGPMGEPQGPTGEPQGPMGEPQGPAGEPQGPMGER